MPDDDDDESYEEVEDARKAREECKLWLGVFTFILQHGLAL